MVKKVNENLLFFQDVVPIGASSITHKNSNTSQHDHDEMNEDDAVSMDFFELANANSVGYRIHPESLQRKKRQELKEVVTTKKGGEPSEEASVLVTIQQDTNACGQHTGGIVWETSYLLVIFLLSRQRSLGKTLEVGSGCGLLGVVLAASGWCTRVVLTEAPEAMNNLQCNVQRNSSVLVVEKKKKSAKKKHKKQLELDPTKNHYTQLAVARELDWLQAKKGVAAYPKDLIPHSFDTIVGTDVVFSQALVKPLLKTLRYMAHKDTVVYLCLQVRCADSHRLLLKKASKYQWDVTEITQDLASIPSCAWGLKIECRLFRFTTIVTGEEKPGYSGDDEVPVQVPKAKKKRKRKVAPAHQEDHSSLDHQRQR